MIFEDYFKNKTMALIGNASSVQGSYKHDIENHDIVIRLNKGFFLINNLHFGTKVNMLGLSMPIKTEILESLDLDYILWCTPKHELKTKYLKRVAYNYPKDWWNILNYTLGARPSTGCMMLDFIYRTGTYKSLKIYNFDFWNSPTFYTNTIHLGNHNPEQEKAYLEALLFLDKRIEWIRNDI